MDLTLPEDFRPFDPDGGFWNYQRNLPHWRQAGATYFITFRLNDSLPADAVEQAKLEREVWEHRISQYKDGLPEAIQIEYSAWQRRTWRKMETIMDQCHGSCLLRDPDIRRIVNDALLFFEGERSSMDGFVVMPNHVHLAVRALGEWQVEDLIKSWKGYTARVINERLQRKGQFWQEDSWNRIIRDEAHWMRVMHYLFANPEKAGLPESDFSVWPVERVFQLVPTVRENTAEDDPW